MTRKHVGRNVVTPVRIRVSGAEPDHPGLEVGDAVEVDGTDDGPVPCALADGRNAERASVISLIN
ncbi:hypothetical protein J2751_001944 [Halorubrum alkaliphilum]|uniref:Uncharacterized protein n=1 Tax=Halorubrum alkaliphilum TaxID=261290 RepID=A0A8T4GEM0_9EURY|nr:hypothetical protein [Halorubrum alkaliphilum]MBP1922928.1 hypothetical protein [Halorubrum alkaliphilum]